MILRPIAKSDPWRVQVPPPEGFELMVAEEKGVPVVLFCIAAAALPEIHMDIRPGAGRHFLAAARLMREWAKQAHPSWPGLWTFVQTTRMERLAVAFGFRRAVETPAGDLYLYHSFNRPALSPSSPS